MSGLAAMAFRCVALVVAVLAPTLLPAGMPARPDLVLLVVVAAGLVRGPDTGALVGLAGGWLVDLVPPSGEPLGAAALTYLGAGALSGWSRRLVAWSPLVPLLATAAVTLAVQGVRGITAAAGVGVVHPVDLMWTVAMTVLFGVLLVPVLLAVERALEDRRWA